MPSQQINLPNFDENENIPRSLTTGPNILHKHSINSLFEQHDLLTRGITSPTEGETLSISDILGLYNSTGNIFGGGQQQQSQSNQQCHRQQQEQIRSNSPNLPTYTPLTPNSTNSSISPGAYNMPSPRTTFDAFQFDNIGQNTPLKLFQRNISYDSSTPMSPTTPSSLYQRSFKGSPKFRDSNSPATNDNPFLYGFSSGSNSPDSDYSAFSNGENNLSDLMNYLNLNQNQQSIQYQHHHQSNQQQPQPQQQKHINNLSASDIQTLNTIKMIQQQQNQQKQVPMLGPMMQNCYNELKNWPTMQQNNQMNTNDGNLDRMARHHRSSAALSDATSTWSGILPQRSNYNKIVNYSNKVFLGGIPPDVSEHMYYEIFKQFGQIRVEWPGKENQSTKPKGYIYIIFESEKQVKSLLSACSIQEATPTSTRKYFYKISAKCLKCQKIEVIPWIISDSNYVKSSSQKLDPSKTVFVGALHGQLTAEGLAKIMDELFEGVVYAGIDTDKHKYPLGSARVTFNNSHSYFKAVTAAFIDVRSSKFKRKIFQIDPYLEDSLCSSCGVQHGPYFCRELTCFRYFCRSCWQVQHAIDTTYFNHKPLSRNSKSQNLIGIGPVCNNTTSPSTFQNNSQQQHQQQLSPLQHQSFIFNTNNNNHNQQ